MVEDANAGRALGGSDPKPPKDPGDESDGPPLPLTTPPEVVGEERLRARVRARLFGANAAPLPGDGAAPTGEAPLPTRVAHFEIRGLLGRGGMGLVLAARDTKLDRDVALKLLDARRGEHDPKARSLGTARMLREAQAMARLNHPNVLTVHEVGTWEEQIYIAMELVEGETLADWIERGPHPWREVLARLVPAGRGLAAAHGAGLVHRDFKPANVLVGRDGRVRVADFGLARAPHEVDAERDAPGSLDSEELDTARMLAEPLTRTGALLGTPAYMAPEQFMGEAVGPAADQFAFGVCLYQALYGQAPFAGDTPAARAMAVARGAMRPPPPRIRVPSWLHAVVARSLAPDPAARFDGMESLLRALTRPRGRWLRRGAAAALALAATGAVWGISRARDPARRCADAGAAMAELLGEPAAATLQARLAEAVGPRIAKTSVDLARDYGERWREAAGRGCRTAAAMGSDDPTGAPAAVCLDLLRRDLSHLLTRATQDPRPVAASLPQVLAALPAPETCLGLREPATPLGPDALATLHRERASLVDARLDLEAGHAARAAERAGAVAEHAASLGHPATEALALYVQAMATERTGKPARAEALLRAAMSRAEAAGDDRTRARALGLLLYVVGRDRGRHDEALTLAEQLRGLLQAIDAPPPMWADFHNNLGAVATSARDLDTALAEHRAALEIRRELLGEHHPATLTSLNSVGSVLSSMGRHEEALATLQRAYDAAEQALGERHPTTVSILGNLANARARAGDPKRALPLLERVLALREALAGPKDPRLAPILYNLGRAQLATEDPAAALSTLSRGLELKRTAGAGDAALLPWLLALGQAQLDAKRPGDALSTLETALGAAERGGTSPRTLGRIRMALARAVSESGGDPARARALARAAEDTFARAGLDEWAARARAVLEPAPSRGEPGDP